MIYKTQILSKHRSQVVNALSENDLTPIRVTMRTHRKDTFLNIHFAHESDALAAELKGLLDEFVKLSRAWLERCKIEHQIAQALSKEIAFEIDRDILKSLYEIQSGTHRTDREIV